MSEKKNILLLRGLTREKAHWYDFPEKLQAGNDEYRIFHLELPGAGKYSNVEFPLKTKPLVNFLNSQVEKFKKDYAGSWHIVTISLGGMVALRYLEAFPNAIDSTVIINSSARDLSPIHHRMQLKIWKDILSVPFKRNANDAEKLILSFVTNLLNEDKIQEVSSCFARVKNENPMSLKNMIKQLVWAAKNSSPKKLHANLFFIASKADRMVDFNCSKKLADKYNASLELHSSAGHDIPLDDGPWLVSKIKNFI